MYFTNAVALDKQGRINLSKYFSKKDKVAIVYDDARDCFEVYVYGKGPLAATITDFGTAIAVDEKGRVHLPAWVKRVAGCNLFLVAHKISGDAVVLKPARGVPDAPLEEDPTDMANPANTASLASPADSADVANSATPTD